MMNKKWWSGVLTAAMVIGLLSGCGGAKENAAQEGAAQDGGKTNLRLYTYGTEEAYNWKKTIQAYEEATPGVTIELVQLSEKGDTQEAFKKLDLEAASSAQMDILMFSDPAGYAQRVALGMAEPLDDFIAKDGYSVETDYKVDTRLDGKVYALPGKFNPWYVLLNKDHLDEAGLPVPTDWTWDEYADYAKKLTQGEGASKRYGTYFHGPQGGGWLEFLKLMMANQPQDTDYLKADGSSNLDNPTFRQTLELRVRMEKEDILGALYGHDLPEAELPDAILQSIREYDHDRQLDEHGDRRNG